MVRHPGEKIVSPGYLIFPDNTTCTCKPCQDEMRKGIGKRFHHFARLPYKVLWKKIVFNKMHQMTDFNGKRFKI